MSLSRVEVVNILIDQKNGVPIVLLQDVASGETLPILIAPLEASLIAVELEGKEPIRPLTHDLIVNIFNEMAFEVESVAIYDLKNNIYYAKLNLITNIGLKEIDCRPSDAIAIALRTDSPIYVSKKLFALSMGLEKAAKEVDDETLKEVLEDIEIDDVGGKIM